MKIFPSRADIAEKVQSLIDGSVSRDQASNWAMNIILDDDYNIHDQVSWKAIKAIGSVNLPSSDRNFLYEQEDFVEWLDILK
jgi:hypothetical protein